ncbi:MAG: DNA topoisomerase (ATP-hydrolyzing) subunit B [Acidimicrobiales bacterium]|nr:DNA topoisomerase (ATP-hydrolyzing) subunit B [Acidimicrobiales bacterium]
MTDEAESYGASDITVLEGLEAVRKRPGMYIGSTGATGLHHLVYEVVDNSVDEAMAGHCSVIEVIIHEDGSAEIRDDGRGIPTDEHAQYEGMSAAEVVLTVLHAGGKFGGGGYKVSGGLHGVGISVVNALSSKVQVEIDREGKHHYMDFADGGAVQTKLEVRGDSPEGHSGTTVRFWPDASIFDETDFRAQTLLERFQMMAFLNKGLRIRFQDHRRAEPREDADEDGWVTFHYEGGIIDFVRHVNEAKESLFSKVGYYDVFEDDQEVEIAFQWNTGFNSDGLHSFANGITTGGGGMHETGFRTALTRTINKYGKDKNLLKETEVLSGDDVREGLTAIISVRLQDPQFEGQTKDKLGNVSVRSMVEKATNEKLAEWLEENPAEGKLIINKAISAQRAREAARAARDTIRNKTALDGAGMPDKLKDCSSKDPRERELFIVEGDSAGGSAIQARDPRTMAILPIRGKILNVERARIDKMLKNQEVQTLTQAIGAGIAEEFDIEKIRYHKVILLADADVDGSHIRTLLLTFFFRQMRELVEAKHVYIAQPPLYSTTVGKEKLYLKDDREKDRFHEEHPNHKKDFQRLKGLGEMQWQELAETTMNPGQRTLLQVSVDQAAMADETFSTLMGEDVARRKHFIQTNAKDVRFLDI